MRIETGINLFVFSQRFSCEFLWRQAMVVFVNGLMRRERRAGIRCERHFAFHRGRTFVQGESADRMTSGFAWFDWLGGGETMDFLVTEQKWKTGALFVRQLRSDRRL